MKSKILLFYVLIILVTLAEVTYSDSDYNPPGDPFGGVITNPPPSLSQNQTSQQQAAAQASTTIYTNTLEISNLDVIVDRSTAKDVKNGGVIGEPAKEESNVEFEIKIKNTANYEIRNIESTVTIENIDDGDDIDKDSESFTLTPGSYKTVNVELDIPLKVDEKDYSVKMHVEGKDLSNNKHIAEWQLKLSVDKESHNLKITKASLMPPSVSCGSLASLEVKLLNLGSKEEDARLEVTSDALGINLKEDNIELDTGADDNAEYEKTFTLSIPAVEKGAYPVKAKAYYNDGKDSTSKDISLNIDSCNKPIKKSASLALKSLPPSIKETIITPKTAASPDNSTISFSYREPLALFLTIMLIVVLGLLVFLFGAVMITVKKQRRRYSRDIK